VVVDEGGGLRSLRGREMVRNLVIEQKRNFLRIDNTNNNIGSGNSGSARMNIAVCL